MKPLRKVLLLPIMLGFSVFGHAQSFPSGSLGSTASQDEFKQEWYTSQLQALDEPSLMPEAGMPQPESYRFLWLRTFDHPIAVRLQVMPDGSGILIAKVTSGDGGFRPGQLMQNSSNVLTKQQTDDFLRQLNADGFWWIPGKDDRVGGLDGSQWVIEGARGSEYHVVDRWSPRNGVVRELELLLAIGLAHMDVPERDRY